jgi:orotidine-5'-phosphate decarboxylase
MKKGTLAAIRRVKGIYLEEPPTDGTPWVADCRSFDIPNTIVGMINNAAPGLVAVTLSPKGGPKMIKMAEHAARKRNIRILWWTY